MWKWLLAVLKAFVLRFQETFKVKVKKERRYEATSLITSFQNDSIMQSFTSIRSAALFQCTAICDTEKLRFYRNGTERPIITKLFKAYFCSDLMISIHLQVKVQISD